MKSFGRLFVFKKKLNFLSFHSVFGLKCKDVKMKKVKKSIEKSHIYDLGSYKFNESDDVDLLQYMITPVRNLQNRYGFAKSAKVSEFKLSQRSTVPEIYEEAVKTIRHPVPFNVPSQCTEKFLKGLKRTVEQVNLKLRALSGFQEFVISTKNFEVIEYAKIRMLHDKIWLYFPVDVKKRVNLGNNEYDVSINFDNPTSLEVGNQSNGCQGSHFGYTIMRAKDGYRIRGHVLITTFIGFPSRNQFLKSKIFDEIQNDPESFKRLVSFTQLCDTALNDDALEVSISTEKGIGTKYDELYVSDRTKLLPDELKVLQNQIYEHIFSLPTCCLFASLYSIRKQNICYSCKKFGEKTS